jgi:hypothetical protein
MSKNVDTTTPYDLARYTEGVVGSWFKQMDEAEKAGIYLPNPGDSCRTCGVQEFCLVVGRSDAYAPTQDVGLLKEASA